MLRRGLAGVPRASAVGVERRSARGPLFSSPEGRLTGGQLWILFAFLVMMVHPVSRNWFIFPVFLSAAAVGGFRWIRRRRVSFSPITLLFVTGVGLLTTLLGVVRGAPGGVFVALPVVLGPMIYYGIALGMDRRIVGKLPGLVAFATALSAVSVLVVAMAGQQSWMFWADPGVGSEELDGAYSVRLGAIGSMTGLIPFMAFYLASWQGARGRRYSLYAAIYVVAVAGALFSGRTAVILVAALSMVVAPLCRAIWWRSSKADRLAQRAARGRSAIPGAYWVGALALIGVTIAALTTPISLSDTINRTFEKFGVEDETEERTAFSVTNAQSSALRQQQGEQLLEGFWESPLVGSGSGAVTGGLIRDERRPWAYELQYHLLLFRNGLLGAGLYVAAVVIGALEIRRRWPYVDWTTRHACIGGMGAAMGILVANATNPYLQAVGQQWALFLPVMVICARTASRARHEGVGGAGPGPPRHVPTG